MSITVNDPTLKALHEQVRERMNLLTDAMAEGSCEDFPAYRHLVGKIDGLAEAERMLLDLDDAMTNS